MRPVVAPHASPARWITAIVASVLCVALASLADGWTYHHVVFHHVYDTDWGRALRTFGYWHTWAIVALAIWWHGRAPGRSSDESARATAMAGWLIASTAVAGILAEGLKLLVRRDRPSVGDGSYVFRAWAERPLTTAGFGMPSSHAVEAFAAAAVLAGWLPETRCLWYALAIGCGVTRLLSGAHFLSDVVAGALLGVLTAHALARRFDPARRLPDG
jgi:membrane-associated phospholipid phosphatase